MRLFVAIDLSRGVLENAERLIHSLRPEALVKWSPTDNLHITTKFIGSFPDERVGEVEAKLATLVHRDSFLVQLRGLGWFPHERSPRVLWAGIERNAALEALAADTETALEGLGIAREQRGFRPHLTLARIPDAVPLTRLKQRVSELRDTELGSCAVSEFFLYRSDPGSNASVYRKVRAFPLEIGERLGV